MVSGENGLRRGAATPIALAARPPRQEMGGLRLRRYRATLLAPSSRLLQELRFAQAAPHDDLASKPKMKLCRYDRNVVEKPGPIDPHGQLPHVSEMLPHNHHDSAFFIFV